MDVYLNGNVNSGNFYVFQYPLRPATRTYGDNGSLDDVSMKLEEESNIKMKYKFDFADAKLMDNQDDNKKVI